jgi:hypothetical protein
MARALTILFSSSLLGCVVSASNTTNSTFDYDVLQYIDPLIGTANGGICTYYVIMFVLRICVVVGADSHAIL